MNKSKQKYIKQEMHLVCAARCLQETLLWPYDQVIQTYINNGCIKNSSLSSADFMRANIIYGPPTCTLKCKMVSPLQTNNYQTQLPPQVYGKVRIKFYINIFQQNFMFVHKGITCQSLRGRPGPLRSESDPPFKAPSTPPSQN